jgi:hypothetical protein
MNGKQQQINIELDQLNTALDVIGKYESGDSRDLKRAIRARIDELEALGESF